MNDLTTSPVSSLSIPIKPPLSQLDVVMAASGPALVALLAPSAAQCDPSTLRSQITGAERLLASADDVRGLLRDGVEAEPLAEIKRQLGQFGLAWPNASRGDLAGYGALLLSDVAERQPCRYALHSALRHLRHTSRFLPSIAEVLAALDEAQTRIRNTAWHLRELPAALERARADLVRAEAFEAHRPWTPFPPAPEAAP